MECPNCHGRGYQVVFIPDPQNKNRKIRVETKCVTCKGTGSINPPEDKLHN